MSIDKEGNYTFNDFFEAKEFILNNIPDELKAVELAKLLNATKIVELRR